MIKYLEVKADTNDADYITSRIRILDEQIAELEPIFTAINNCKSNYNWGSGEYCDEDEHPYVVYQGILTEDQIDLFDQYVPHGEHGVHSIESVNILIVQEEIRKV